jgi:hypothetical protein
METANRRMAAQAMSTLPRYAEGGFIDGLKRAVGIKPDSPELKAYKERAAAELAASKAPKPAAATMAAPPNAITSYAGGSATANRLKAVGEMAGGGAIEGKGTGTSDEIPILASNGEYMIRAAAVEEIGTDVLDAINALGEDRSTEDDPEDKQPGKYAVGGIIDRSGSETKNTPEQQQQFANQTASYVQGAQASAAAQPAAQTMAAPAKPVTPQLAPLQGNTAYDMVARDTVDTAKGAFTNAGDSFSKGNYSEGLGKLSRGGLDTGIAAAKGLMTPGIAMADTLVSGAKNFASGFMGNPATGAPAAQPSASVPKPAPVAPPNAVGADTREPYQAKYPVQPTASFVTPEAPKNSFGDAASWNSNRQPMNAQDQMAMDGIQARQDNRDAGALQRMQYDKEVAAADAVNKFQADRGKSVARLAMEGQLAQNVRGDATTRYQSDNALKGAGLSAGASRYSTDMQRESNQGNLGVAQGRLANDTQTSELDNQSKQQVLAAQQELANAKTPEQEAAAEKKLRALQGKYGKDQTTYWKGIAGGTDAMGNKTDPFLYNEATGETKRASGEQPGGKPQVTRAQVDAAAKAKGISDPAQLKKMYATYGV